MEFTKDEIQVLQKALFQRAQSLERFDKASEAIETLELLQKLTVIEK